MALWQVSVVASLVCHGGSALCGVLCAMMAWHCGSCACWGGVVAGLVRVGACTPCWDSIGVALWQVVCAITEWRLQWTCMW